MEFTFKSALSPFESITFERGKDLRETINIGRIGNPIKISGLYHPDPTRLQKIMENPRMETEGQLHILTSKVGDKFIRRILQGIIDGEITGDWAERYYVSYWDEESSKKLAIGITTVDLQFATLGELSGEYLQYGDDKFLIP